MFDILVAKVNNIDTSGFVLKTKNDTDKSELEKKISNASFWGKNSTSKLITKTDFDTKLISLNKKTKSNKTKHLLADNWMKKLQTFDLIYFGGKSYFEEDVTHNYSVFQPMCRYLKMIARVGSDNHVYYRKSKGLPEKNVKHPTTTDYSLTPKWIYISVKTRV